jgi:predicted membrane metal-binding protein
MNKQLPLEALNMNYKGCAASTGKPANKSCLPPSRYGAQKYYLSFLAVFCIIYVLSGRLGRENRFLSSLKLHFVVGLGLLPVLLFFFQQASLVSPVANFLAIPIVSFLVVPLALFAVALLPVMPDSAAFLLQIVDSVLLSLSPTAD